MSGYTVVAERLNFLRFISHFRSIHRGQVCSLPYVCVQFRAAAAAAAPCGNTQAPSAGRRSASCVFVRFQFFAEMKTTECRRLMGDVWGFLCPVHTPDGSPCGLRPSRPLPCTVYTHAHARCASHTHVAPHASVRAEAEMPNSGHRNVWQGSSTTSRRSALFRRARSDSRRQRWSAHARRWGWCRCSRP